MLIDIKNPIQISLITFTITFIIFVGILFLTKPNWVQVFDKKSGKMFISWVILSSYAITFALVFSIAALLLSSKWRGPLQSSLDTYADES